MKTIFRKWYAIIIALGTLLYSVGLSLSGNLEEAQYTANWPATILLFTIAIEQRKIINNKNKENDN
jgi:hypothetical protein